MQDDMGANYFILHRGPVCEPIDGKPIQQGPLAIKEINLDGVVIPEQVGLHVDVEVVDISGLQHIVGLLDGNLQALRLDGD